MATSNKKRVAIAIFSGAGGLEAALAELVECGVEYRDLCLLARESAIGNMVRGNESVHLALMAKDLVAVGRHGGTESLVTSTGREMECLLSAPPKEKSISECLNTWIPARQSRSIDHSLDRGEVVLCVNVDADDNFNKVPQVLLLHTSHAVQLHEVSGPVEAGCDPEQR